MSSRSTFPEHEGDAAFVAIPIRDFPETSVSVNGVPVRDVFADRQIKKARPREAQTVVRTAAENLDVFFDAPIVPKVLVRGDEDRIFIRPLRYELLEVAVEVVDGNELRRRGYVVAAMGFPKASFVLGLVRVRAVVRVVDRESTAPRILRVTHDFPLRTSPETEGRRREVASRVFEVVRKSMLHELKEVLLLDGKNFADPEPDHHGSGR